MMKKRIKIISLIIVAMLILLGVINSVMAKEIQLNNKTIDTKILDEFNQNQTWVRVIVDLKNISETNNFLSNFSAIELQNIIRNSISTRIDAEITKKGFDKLINDSRVEAVYLNVEVQGTNPKNEINYTAEVEPDVLNVLNNSEWAPVIIKIYERNDTLRDIVLSNLSEDEFQLSEKLLREDAFSGNITKKGLDKLIVNPIIKTIYLNRIAYTTKNETEIKKNGTNFLNISWLIIASVLIIFLVIIYIIFRKKK